MGKRLSVAVLLLSASLSAEPPALDRAKELYERTDYQATLQALKALPDPDAAALLVAAKCYFQTGEFN
jgi:hypothetical protein